MKAARANYPSAAHLFPSPPIASPPLGLDDDAIATLTAGKTIPDRQVAILRMLDPETLRLFVNLAPSPDDRSTADSFTINTVDYVTVDANTSYLSRAAFTAAAATTSPQQPIQVHHRLIHLPVRQLTFSYRNTVT